MKKIIFILILVTFSSFFANKSVAASIEVARCEGCSDASMEAKAKQVVNSQGEYEVYVFSTSTQTIKAFTVDVFVEREPGFEFTEKYARTKTVPAATKSEFDSAVRVLNRIAGNPRINIGTSTCADSSCLETLEGMAYVTNELTAAFILPYYKDAVVKYVLKVLFDEDRTAFMVEACFADGKCVEFVAVQAQMSSMGWAPTGQVSGNSSGGGTSSGGGSGPGNGVGSGNANSFMLVCTEWVEYQGTTADGVYCESMDVIYI